MNIVPVILCGGSGSRLWPFSRGKTPKQFLRLLDNDTLLQKTARRTLEILGPEQDIVIVTLAAQAEETAAELADVAPHLTRHILSEPSARNTAAAVALAAMYLRSQFGRNAYAWILPADHYIGEPERLKGAVRQATEAAAAGMLVTFGIEPTRAETGFGYIRKDDRPAGGGAYRVKSFVEKPPAETARQYVESGEYLWSSGMHMFGVGTVLDAFRAHAPEILRLVENAVDPGSVRMPSAAIYRNIDKQPFETAVIEKAQNVAVVPCNPLWSDIGSWEALWEIKPKDEKGNAFEGRVYSEDTENSMVVARNRLVTCVGLKDVVVVETGDSVLVAEKSCNGSLKNLVEALKADHCPEVHETPVQHEEWGCSRSIFSDGQTELREIIVHPEKARLKNIAMEDAGIFVSQGEGQILVDEDLHGLAPGVSVSVPAHSFYSIRNTGRHDLIYYEMINPSEAAKMRPAMAGYDTGSTGKVVN